VVGGHFGDDVGWCVGGYTSASDHDVGLSIQSYRLKFQLSERHSLQSKPKQLTW
jgi:hypothetical protein